MRRVTIIGGGFTGALVAIQLSRTATRPLDIVVVEPRKTLGGGLAYGAEDPDHRVNGTHELLIMLPDDVSHFTRWFESSGGLARDPEARWDATGVIYVRRSEVGRYMDETLKEHARENPSGSTIRHLQSRAMAASRNAGVMHVKLENGSSLDSETLILALAGQRPASPRGVAADAIADPAFVNDPLKNDALSTIPQTASVLLVGSGLTAADIIATLARRGHTGRIQAISRRGLRPQPQGQAPDISRLMTRLARPLPRFVERHGMPLTLMQAFRALRSDFASATERGDDQKAVFDDARDAASFLWPRFSFVEKRRFLRHLKPWYDVNRYRMVPQTGAVIDRLERSGQLSFRKARLVAAERAAGEFRVQLAGRGGTLVEQTFDAIINCTGPQSFTRRALFASLIDNGLARPDPLGLGLCVNADNQVLDGDGKPQSDLWAFGLVTRGQFGDMTAIPQIALRVNDALPGLASAATGGQG